MEKLKIFVCAHKKDAQIRTESPYCPIHGGKALHPDLDLGFPGDDTGDNISAKNPQYCEWSVIYWMWKNCKDTEYIGLNHYRRYFKADINCENISSLMDNVDLIAVKGRNKSKCSRLADLTNMTSQEDAYLFVDSYLSIHQDCKQAMIKYLYNSTESYPYSMFIMRRDLFEEYCRFVFPVLFDLEKRIKPHGYSRQQRAIAYFGEFSLGLFVFYKHLKVKGVELVGTSGINGGPVKKVLRSLRNLYFKIPESMLPVPKDVVVPDEIKVGFRNDSIELKSLK